jgi:trans-aconitate methyltransferase
MALPAPSKFLWNASDYAANSSSQQVQARELIARIQPRGDEHILDVGCGDGKITAELARAVSRGSATGIDASPQMIEFAMAAFSPDTVPNLEFRVMDARRIQLDKTFDLVFSNAALHWVDDHEAFLRGAASALRPGGRLIFSCGGKGNALDVFAAFRPEMRRQRWREYFRNLRASYFFYSPDDYRKWLPAAGFEARQVRLTPKDATHEGREGFTAWLRTTWLPYTQRVPEATREEFLTGVVDRYLARHPLDTAGRVHVKMVRLEVDAVKL